MKCLWRNAAVLCATVFVAAVSGYEDRPVLNRYGHKGLLRVYSAQMLGATRLAFNLSSNGSTNDDFVTKVIFADTGRAGLDTIFPAVSILEVYPSVALGLFSFADISLTLPLFFDLMGSFDMQGGIGDIEVGLKLGVPSGKSTRLAYGALLASLSIPTGDRSQGYFAHRSYYFDKDSSTDDSPELSAPSLFTSQNTELDLRLLWTLDFGAWSRYSALQIHANPGVRLVSNARLDNVLVIAGALQYSPAPWFTLFGEYSQEMRFQNVAGFRADLDPIRLSPGLSMKNQSGFTLTLGTDFSLASDSVGTYTESRGKQIYAMVEPRWRVAATIGWSGILAALDTDGDLIRDSNDECPAKAEDVDGYLDSDGCPDDDNDRDGIPDKQDRCPNAAEDFDQFEDNDGCPDLDDDRDLVADSIDQCRREKEDFDGHEDFDGCPEADNDKDGVIDALDKCIMDPEDRDGFEDDDGCPDIDNDHDGIRDSVDRCPSVFGTSEYQGCPDQGVQGSTVSPPLPREIKRGRVILRGVDFHPGKPTLTGESYMLLDQLFESLQAWPAIKIEVRAHTKSQADPKINMALSWKRAEEVCTYLVNKGISPSRVRAVGKGETDPIGDNATAEGRALNSRIEVHRFD